MKSPMNVKISVKEICIFHIVNSFNTASPSHDKTDRLCRCFLLCRIAGEFIVFRCKYMYYFCSFNLFVLFFSLFSRQRCKLSSRNRFPNPLRNRRGHVSYRMQKCWIIDIGIKRILKNTTNNWFFFPFFFFIWNISLIFAACFQAQKTKENWQVW